MATPSAPMRFFTKGDQKGLFDDIKSAQSMLTFDKSGRPALSSLARTGYQGYTPFSGGRRGPNADEVWKNHQITKTVSQFNPSIMDGLNAPVSPSPWGWKNAEATRRAQAQANNRTTRDNVFNTFSTYLDNLMKGNQYADFYEDKSIKEVYGEGNAPLSWEDYFKKSQEGYQGELSTGKKIGGAELFRLIAQQDMKQALGYLQDIENNYDQYLNEYRDGANAFISNRQAMTDTDPNKRNAVANYDVGGEYAPTGASGWGRGNVQSSEGFQDTRRRGWGQTEVQGV